MCAPFSGREGRDVEDLELQPDGVVEEQRVVAGHVRVFLRLALYLSPRGAQPVGALVDGAARGHLEGEMMQADGVAVVWTAVALCLAEADRAPSPGEVPDGLTALALDLADAVPAER